MNKFRNERNAKIVSNFWGKSLKDSGWYSVDTSGDEAEVLIYDVIGWPWIDANEFARDFNRIDASYITVGINSPGGDVFDGTAIFNTIQNHSAKITTRIDGIAASMASIIALAGDEIQIASNAYYMMHNPWSFEVGDYRDFQRAGDLLERIAGNLAETYSERAGIKVETAQSMMDDETWLIGKELVDEGFADKVIGEQESSALFDLSMYSNAPKEINGQPAKKPIDSERELERLLTQDAGLTRSVARAMIKAAKSSIFKQDAGVDDHTESIAALNKLISNLET